MKENITVLHFFFTPTFMAPELVLTHAVYHTQNKSARVEDSREHRIPKA